MEKRVRDVRKLIDGATIFVSVVTNLQHKALQKRSNWKTKFCSSSCLEAAAVVGGHLLAPLAMIAHGCLHWAHKFFAPFSSAF